MRGGDGRRSRQGERAPSSGSSCGCAPATTESWRDEAAVTIAEAMAVFERAGDDAGLAKGWRLLAWTHGTACHLRQCRGRLGAGPRTRAPRERRAATDARRAPPTRPPPSSARRRSPRRSSAASRSSSRSREIVSAEGILLALLASLLAMEGSFERARELTARRSRDAGRPRPRRARSRARGLEAWRVEMLAGDVPCRRARASPRVRPAHADRREVPALDRQRPARPDAVRARTLRRGGAARPARAGAHDRGRHRHAGALALRPGQGAGPARSFDEAETYVREALEILARDRRTCCSSTAPSSTSPRCSG